ncbi:hypothetical protein B0H10DRAFT_1943333 [Mycena sp. CBHHK59/15]|nr:hypothetical protein B0H10DRAFT_1943333 [Mycena sp. CBHHK59/15]
MSTLPSDLMLSRPEESDRSQGGSNAVSGAWNGSVSRTSILDLKYTPDSSADALGPWINTQIQVHRSPQLLEDLAALELVHTVRDALWYILQSPPPKEPRSQIQMTLQYEDIVLLSNTHELFYVVVPGSKVLPNCSVQNSCGKVHLCVCSLYLLESTSTRTITSNLTGCVADTNDMQAFLEKTLCVPPSRIQNLCDEHTTRERIMKHIGDLAFNPNLNIKNARPTNAKIQMLLPHDFVPQTTDDKSVQGIPDITLGALLSNIAVAKGNNIMVILDTCHSGSACMEHQPAIENHGHGVFNQELLKLLRTAGADKLTYKQAIECLPDLPM